MPTTLNQLDYPASTDAPDGPGAIFTLADEVDKRLGTGGAEGTATAATLAAIPSARLFPGKRAFVTGLGGGLFFRYNGTAWFVEGPVDRMTATQRAALPAANLWDGYRVMETDTGLAYVWVARAFGGAQWVLAGIGSSAGGNTLAGIAKQIPTTLVATGGGTVALDANGDAVGTGVGALRLDGIIDFTRFRRYRLQVTATNNSVATTGIYVVGSFAGVPETGTAFWAYTRTTNNAGTLSNPAVTSQNAGMLAPSGAAANTLYSAEAVLGKFDGTNRAFLDVNAGISAGAGSQSQTAHVDYFTSKDLLTMDGLQIFPGGGTVNLRVAVYGMV